MTCSSSRRRQCLDADMASFSWLVSICRLSADIPMYDLLKLFRVGRSHMALLTQPHPEPSEDGSPRSPLLGDKHQDSATPHIEPLSSGAEPTHLRNSHHNHPHYGYHPSHTSSLQQFGVGIGPTTAQSAHGPHHRHHSHHHHRHRHHSGPDTDDEERKGLLSHNESGLPLLSPAHITSSVDDLQAAAKQMPMHHSSPTLTTMVGEAIGGDGSVGASAPINIPGKPPRTPLQPGLLSSAMDRHPAGNNSNAPGLQRSSNPGGTSHNTHNPSPDAVGAEGTSPPGRPGSNTSKRSLTRNVSGFLGNLFQRSSQRSHEGEDQEHYDKRSMTRSVTSSTRKVSAITLQHAQS